DEKEWKKAAARVHRHNAQLRTARVDFLKRLQLAEELTKHRQFFFPHNFDFRGRCYPIPPHLNHQGADFSRGLLRLATPKEPDETGHRWLKIHAASVYGLDKASFDERVSWTDANLDRIQEAAQAPLDCDWWHPRLDEQGRQVGGAEKPWQFLAAA